MKAAAEYTKVDESTLFQILVPYTLCTYVYTSAVPSI